MPQPVTTCEHCGTHLNVPLMPGAPNSGHMPGGSIVCGHCGKRTRVQDAFIIHDPLQNSDEPSYRIPAFCPRCHHPFVIDFGAARANAATSPQKIDMRCPRCHTEAVVQPGRYDAIEGGMQFVPMEQALADVKLAPEDAQRLLALFEAAAKNPQRHQDQIRAALKDHPILADLAARFIPTEATGTSGWLTAIVTLLLYLQARKQLRTAKVKRHQAQLRRAAHRAADEKAKEAEDRKKRRDRLARKAAREARLAREAAERLDRAPRKTWKDPGRS